ncbi:hypothetical protein C8F01DRAFT_1378786 [Mycena amicta]|nr:hypothetical protein C8F01DRAFT_1378786 [Mycena amicta]
MPRSRFNVLGSSLVGLGLLSLPNVPEATPARIPASSMPVLIRLGHLLYEWKEKKALALTAAPGNIWSITASCPGTRSVDERRSSRARKSNLPVALGSRAGFPCAFLESEMPRERPFDSEADLGVTNLLILDLGLQLTSRIPLSLCDPTTRFFTCMRTTVHIYRICAIICFIFLNVWIGSPRLGKCEEPTAS